MRRAPLRLAGIIAALLAAACQPAEESPADAAAAAAAPAQQNPGGDEASSGVPIDEPVKLPGPKPPAGAEALPPPGAEPTAPPVPHVYMAVQPGATGHPASIVFAIDAARDGTPSDDPAIRLTPEAGRCNPQEMRNYGFPADAAPVVSESEQARGLTARDLPRFMAAAVTGRLIETGLATEPEDTRALNICTRKLWERLVLAENRDRLSAGQQ